MSKYRYILEPYKGMKSRYTCPECTKPGKFVRYIDKETNEYLGDRVGKCERSDNCAYHYTPKQYFEDNGMAPGHNTDVATQKQREPEKPLTLIDPTLVEKSLTGYESNNFIKYLNGLFDSRSVYDAVSKYKVGTSKHWPGSTIFWQIDQQGNARAGKIMQYNPTTGKRVKEPRELIQWVHIILKLKNNPNFNLKQCFFGQHLLVNNCKPVAIVESEKTAIIAGLYLPQFLWIASGNKQGLSAYKCAQLKGKKVILYPDLNAYKEWNEKAKLYGFKVSDLLEKKATEEERSAGLDLADYLIRFDVSEFQDPARIETHTIESNPPERRKAEPVQAEEATAISLPAIDPELLILHTQYLTAAAAGKLDDHPDRSLIGGLWQAVLINRSRPAQLHYYIEQLKQITI